MGKARKCNCEENISEHYTGTAPEKVHPESEVWIREGGPVIEEDAARLAESFMSARRRNQDVTFSRENQQDQSGKSFGGEEGSGQPQTLYFSKCRQFSLQTPSHKKSLQPFKQEVGY